MSSAAMASSSVSQEELEHDFEKTSRRSRIRMARGRDVRGQQTASTAGRIAAAETLAEAEDGGEPRAADAAGYSGDHDASPKPAARAKDKRPTRPPHTIKGKQQQRDRRKLREKRRSTGVVHMPSTEVSSTGGSTNEDDEDLSAGRETAATAAETRRNTQQNEQTELVRPPDQFQNPLRNKSLSDLDADDEDNQDCDSVGQWDSPSTACAEDAPATPTAAGGDRAAQLAGENARLRRALAERDRRISGLEAALSLTRDQRDGLERAIAALRAQ